MAGFHTQIKLSGYPFEDSQIGVNLAASITAAHVGKAMAQDTSAPNTVKPAGDGDEIVGVLLTYEDRINEGQKVGTVTFRFAKKLPIKAGLAGGEVVAVGSRLVGAGNGEVKALAITDAASAAKYAAAPRVWEVEGTNAIATLIA